MSDKPRPWPQVAALARNQAAEAALEGMKALQPLIDSERSMTETEILRRVMKAHRMLHKIAWTLQAQGAPIRPESL